MQRNATVTIAHSRTADIEGTYATIKSTFYRNGQFHLIYFFPSMTEVEVDLFLLVDG